MSQDWTTAEISDLRRTKEISLAVRGQDGRLGQALPVWVITTDTPDIETVAIRSANGPTGSWYRRALTSRQGRITVGRQQFDVNFIPVTDDRLSDLVDRAWLGKYGRWEKTWSRPIITPEIREATLCLVPERRTTNPGE